jgi:hypothetical protein
MARLARVIPARPGLTFPTPAGFDLPPEGLDVDIDALFWMRRLLDGDVRIQSVDPTPAAPAASTDQ